MIMLKLTVAIPSEKRKEFYQTASTLARRIRKETGCISHHWYRDLENRSIFLLIEQWESDDHLTNHLVSEGFAILFGALKTLADQQSIHFALTPEGGDTNCVTGDNAVIQNLRNSLHASLGR